jgi:hypothetical protein
MDDDIEIHVMKETTDCWYPSYKTTDGTYQLVSVFLFISKLEQDYRVCLSGADDMDITLKYQTEKEAFSNFYLKKRRTYEVIKYLAIACLLAWLFVIALYSLELYCNLSGYPSPCLE